MKITTASLLLEDRAKTFNPNKAALYPAFQNFPTRNAPYK